MESDLARTIFFLRSIGLSVEIRNGARGFIDGVRIEQGRLLVDPLCRASSLIHEAAHISCVPGRFRAYMSDDLKEGMRRMMEEIRAMNLEPDHALERAAIQCSDPEATAWSWAAGLAIGLSPEQIILLRRISNGISRFCWVGWEILFRHGFCFCQLGCWFLRHLAASH